MGWEPALVRHKSVETMKEVEKIKMDGLTKKVIAKNTLEYGDKEDHMSYGEEYVSKIPSTGQHDECLSKFGLRL